MRAKLVKENIEDLLVPKSKEDIINKLNKLSQEKKDEKLFNAVIKGQLEIIKLLIETGANVNAKNINGDTALMYAYGNKRKDIVKLLKNYGAK
jgi:ankyrin repeat protein